MSGTTLAAVATVIGPWWILSGFRGRWFLAPPNDRWLVFSSLGLIVIIFLEWMGRLWLSSGS